MKLLISFFLITVYLRVAHAALAKQLFYDLSVAVFDDELETFLENLKPILKTGNDSLGIPSLNPYEMEYYDISSTTNNTSIDGDISDVKVDGLSNYTINHAKFRLGHMQVKLNLTWPNITVNSLYRINAEIFRWRYLPLYGKGDVQLEATNFTMIVAMKMGLKSGKILVREMSTSYHLKDINFRVTGIYDCKEVSHLANAIVSSHLPYFIENYQGLVSNQINSKAMDVMNRQLAELTFEDFLNIIG